MKALLSKIGRTLFRCFRPTVEIYTDGSFKNGRGSWAYVIVRNGIVSEESSGSARQTTSLRMEIQATIEAIKSLPENSSATLLTDCRILVDFIASQKKVDHRAPNSDLLNLLVGFNEQRTINWKWIRSHSGLEFNERCDRICKITRAN